MEHTVDYAPATGALSGIWLLVAIPLFSAAVLLLLGKRADRWGHWLGVLAVAGSFVLGLIFFIQLGGLADEHRSAELSLFDFIDVGSLKVDFGLLFDPLSGVFVLLITGVGSLIHLYAVGYMAHDPGRRRFFAYFNLFVAAMLLLVLGNNYVLLYFGWEGVGLASYLLISFWYTRPSAATAGKKAFLMNRVGDAGLAIGVFLMFTTLGSTQYADVFNGVTSLSATTVLVLGLLLLLGACGKSGQFPLQAWLPDAMEGPTPVSALIHAATMVTAGVYLIARSNPIFSANTTLQLVVVSVGALTLLIGCVIGAAKDDIKRVLAWSTVSQIGYMFLGVGLGGAAYGLAIVHLLAHGFFKANMFLGAGSVMHGMHDQVDIRRFGALAKPMRITWLTFATGWLAIIGIPPLSGFFSKEPIIAAAFEREVTWEAWTFGLAALIGAGLTAFYMTRLFVLTFHGPSRWTEENRHPHESPAIMTVPLVLLAIGSVAAGWVMSTTVPDWLNPVFGAEQAEAAGVLSHTVITVLSLLVTVAGAGLAWAMFRNGTALEPKPAGIVVTAARRNLYTDAFNEAVFERPGKYLTRALVYLDAKGIDGLVNGLAAAVGGSSGRLRRLQTGFVRSYALSMLTGAMLVVGAFLAIQLGWLA
ncbi:NADH-quinone oxidoreductase subunit L [Actinoplanes teichomyceticus]|uniref:NADH dehydrogenase subunit L n=1 Tax=Actinoplanes teichomyceticus TaxID=1867 RepID=A0A561WS65_ACTTI|nr:NADH-quinone oxidoreductase subunit L [Actinoplanes teichomyceticus]TWG26686.1 NADH dehydrogenase subunit L [Actinoplanes teichomyceticus]GIF15087.1 NADH-quinone oxidoreductase subunit L [Actinoplanes teichomyceticus]